MKIVHKEILIDVGNFSSTKDWGKIENHIISSIRSIEWPPGSKSFTLYDQPGKIRGQGSGVKPIKEKCMLKLKSFGWRLETPLDIATVMACINSERGFAGDYCS